MLSDQISEISEKAGVMYEIKEGDSLFVAEEVRKLAEQSSLD